MTEKAKLKLPYVLALLAALISLNQIPPEIKSAGFTLFNLQMTISNLYTWTATLLAIASYFYAIDLISDNKYLKFASYTGDLSFVLSILAPVLFACLFIASSIIDLAKHWNFSTDAIQVTSYFSIVTALISTTLSVYSLYRQMKIQTDKAAQNDFRIELEKMLAGAQKAAKNDLYDMAIMTCWRIFEYSIVKINGTDSNKNPFVGINEFLSNMKKQNRLSESMIKQIDQLRRLRNEVAHNKSTAKNVDAINAISLTSSFILFISNQEESCFFCNKSFKISEMKKHSLLEEKVCQSCQKLHPNWENEMIDMGMDP